MIKLRHGASLGVRRTSLGSRTRYLALVGGLLAGLGLQYWRCVPAIAFAQWLIMAHLELHDL